MKHKKLKREFFNQPTLIVANDLLGKYLVRKIPSTHSTRPQGGEPAESTRPQGGEPAESTRSPRPELGTKAGQVEKIVAGKIIETEAYCGPNDLASHASRGRTKRTEVMFGKPGLIYVYMIYGMYHCLNIVTEKEEYPAAVLIRAIDLENCNGVKPRGSHATLRGPGKLCREFKIDKRFNGADICKNSQIWIEDRGEKIGNKNILTTPRIGIDYAGKYKDKPWRFILDQKN